MPEPKWMFVAEMHIRVKALVRWTLVPYKAADPYSYAHKFIPFGHLPSCGSADGIWQSNKDADFRGFRSIVALDEDGQVTESKMNEHPDYAVEFLNKIFGVKKWRSLWETAEHLK